ncbi:MAG: contractile injection system protein, VgrG/Pvc8 family, partial [Actinomycetota bacterium]|nr:contractile injection system protein, VgrG/Pvc8 family [Actinomycetota bacterium]
MPATLPLKQIPDVSGFVLKLGDTEVPREFADAVVAVDVHEEVGRLARARLVLNNWDEETREVRHSDGDELQPGTEVEIQLGWEDEFTTVFEGVVVSLDARFPPKGTPVLEVSCRCRGSLLAAGLRSRVFEEMTDGDVVGAIGGDHGLTPEADAGPTNPFLVQAAETDWDFLRERQAALGHALYVRGKELRAKQPAADGDPVATLEWGSTLLELRLRQEAGGRVAKTVARAWDPEALAPAEAEAAPGDSGMPEGPRPALEAA